MIKEDLDRKWQDAYFRYVAGFDWVVEQKKVFTSKVEEKVEDPWLEDIKRFVYKKVPKTWLDMDIATRIRYMNDPLSNRWLERGEPTEWRDRLCAQEIWVECLKREKSDLTRTEISRINAILNSLDGWERWQGGNLYGPYGKLSGCFKRDVNATVWFEEELKCLNS